MAEEGGQERSREDLSEEASPYKIEEMRRKGQVSQSKEISGLIALIASAATTYAMAPHIGANFAEYMREIFRVDVISKLDLTNVAVIGLLFENAIGLSAKVGLPILGMAFVMGALGSYVQIGSIFSTEPLTPDLKKIDPISGFQRLFSTRQAIDGLRILGKISIISVAAYFLVKSEVISAPLQMHGSAGGLLEAHGRVALRIVSVLIAILAVFAILDFIHQKWEYGKKIRLTKEEAKREHKEREGDPQVKARIRAVQREMARKRMMDAIKTADVVITNPTHIAVALKYDKDKMAAPKVIAKGADFLAQRIKKIAAEASIPMVENVPLARTLYKSVKVGQGIPRVLYQAVAEVLAYVYRLKNQNFRN